MTSALPRLQRSSEGNPQNPPLSNQSQLGPKLTPKQLKTLNQRFDRAKATELIEWGVKTFGDTLVMSTSFGIQSAVMLGLVTEVIPEIPVVWVDTGYLPAETYRFAEALTQRLSLNLKVYQSPLSPARMEALYGRLWEEGTVEAFNQYDTIRKVEPMNRALEELGARAWLTGLRSQQTDHRKTLNRIDEQAGRYKLLPILHWHSKDVYDYLKTHNLPYHPFFEEGYVSVGDWHSSRPLTADDTDARATRFNGLKQECGIHIPQTPEEAESLNSSSL
ncbi:phosphoadenosine phosphosulfate reductase [Synechococcus sp. PCC 7335]|uniref:phosphoadenylyl-sulfate reductase n=1 Tax=Synechococcus sp. (strain ATCC 29403 / PCC 7335) TaxID=91464 RepID=UPI00017EBBEB|nr:phosphoadenylyl-sulfate reductase [Synechococcus sp. PCC 7335]EDX84447.1 phosphoadenosine phosphosulfate reductase [Synechococcus sp. PCC 7335]